eukprot:6193180-Heterocapsa_arctica.AAC.1
MPPPIVIYPVQPPPDSLQHELVAHAFLAARHTIPIIQSFRFILPRQRPFLLQHVLDLLLLVQCSLIISTLHT